MSADGDYLLLEEDLDAEAKKSKIRRVFALAYPERYILLMGTVALFLSSFTQMIVPSLFAQLIDTISHTKDRKKLDDTVLMMIIVFSISGFFSFVRASLFTLAGERVVARFRKRLFNSIINQDITFFDRTNSGELQSRLSNDTSVIQNAVTVNISMGLRWMSQLVVATCIIFVISWKLTLIMLSVVPAIAVASVFYGRFVRKLSKEYQEALARAGETAEQAFSCIRTVRSFSKEPQEIKNYSVKINESYHYGARRAWAYGTFTGVLMIAVFLAIAFVLWEGGKMVINEDGEMESKDLTAFLLYTIYIAGSVAGLTGLWSNLMTAVGASERMFELLDRKPSINNRSGLYRTTSTGNFQLPTEQEIPTETRLPPFKGHIRFDHVTFAYPTRPDVLVLNDVSFECQPGQVTAFVGQSGGGKSTVISLIERFYDPVEGTVYIDGKPLQCFDPVHLHSNVATVSQEPTLFANTIGNNIKYGVHRAGVTQEDIERVAKQANAHDFISGFPDGYDTEVGERGVQLSGGQKQRVAIARAILVDPKILLLDEATSALDSESEHLVQEALDRLMANRTTLVVAHRLSTIQNADCICAMDHGTIVERGTHQELIQKKDGIYHQLVTRQLQQI